MSTEQVKNGKYSIEDPLLIVYYCIWNYTICGRKRGFCVGYTVYVLDDKGYMMTVKKDMGGEKLVEKKKSQEKKTTPEDILSEEMVRWMTEGTNPNHIPRSDCG